MRRLSVFAAVVAVVVAGGCNDEQGRQRDTARTSVAAASDSGDTTVLEMAGDAVKTAHVRVGIVCANGQADVHIRGWIVRVPRGAEVKWHLARGGPARVTIVPKDTATRSWGLQQPLPLDVSSGDSVSGGEAQTEGTWRYNLRYECRLGDSTYQGLIDPEIIIVPGGQAAAPDQ